MGDVCDFRNYVNAVIDENSFDKIMSYINKAGSSENAQIIAGGKGDKSTGYFIEPTIIVTENPHFSQWRKKYSDP